MQQITFDENDNLLPYALIKMDLSDFESHFCSNAHRRNLFDILQDYFVDLRLTIKSPVKIWLDGSYITTKELPNDIDLVTFVNDFEFLPKRDTLMSYKIHYKNEGLDAHFVCVFPNFHHNHIVTEYDTNEYRKLFSYDRDDRKKGFIQLKNF